MNRRQLEHLIRAAADIAEDDAVVVIGSQSILAQFPDAPESLLSSMEADIYPLHHPDRADVVDGSIGELSMFHDTFGYYAQGVGEETATLPDGWRDRLVPIHTRGVTGWCLEVPDLAVSKAVAGREKDLEFLVLAARANLIDRSTVFDRLRATKLDPALRPLVEARLSSAFEAQPS